MGFGDVRSLVHAAELAPDALWRQVRDLPASDSQRAYVREHLARRRDGEQGWWWTQARVEGLVDAARRVVWSNPLGPPPLVPSQIEGAPCRVVAVNRWGRLGLVTHDGDVADALVTWSCAAVEQMLEEYELLEDPRCSGVLRARRAFERGEGVWEAVARAAQTADFEMRAPHDHKQSAVDACAALGTRQPRALATRVAYYVWEPSRHFGDGAHTDAQWRRLGQRLAAHLHAQLMST